MMIFEHDDERTLDDEEAISNSESVTQELSQLEHVCENIDNNIQW